MYTNDIITVVLATTWIYIYKCDECRLAPVSSQTTAVPGFVSYNGHASCRLRVCNRGVD